jgi:hypothetical protein
MELIESFKEYWAYRIEVRFRDSKDKWGRPDIYSNLYTSSTADAIVKKSNETSVCGLQFRKVADTKVLVMEPEFKPEPEPKKYKIECLFQYTGWERSNDFPNTYTKEEAERLLYARHDGIERRIVELQ